MEGISTWNVTYMYLSCTCNSQTVTDCPQRQQIYRQFSTSTSLCFTTTDPQLDSFKISFMFLLAHSDEIQPNWLKLFLCGVHHVRWQPGKTSHWKIYPGAQQSTAVRNEFGWNWSIKKGQTVNLLRHTAQVQITRHCHKLKKNIKQCSERCALTDV